VSTIGTIYLRGKTWWVRYYSQGKEHRESAGSQFKHDAERLPKRREGEIAEGKVPGVYYDRIHFDGLAQDYLRDYRLSGRRSITKARRLVYCLSQSFAGMRITQITTSVPKLVDNAATAQKIIPLKQR